jgi:dihydroflavonol-4-reductase
MPGFSENSAGTVLVTGGSGYLGGYVVSEALRRGYHVRSTIRSLAKEAAARAQIAELVEAEDRLQFVEADLLSDAGWDRAAEGCDAVLHVASPMPVGEFKGHDVIRPARDGTRRVLEAAVRAGTKRVVITSSASAAIPRVRGAVADETVWTDLPSKAIFNYPRSKTLAERDAWAFAAEHPQLELVTLLPSSIQGPVLGSDYSASIEFSGLMLRGKMPATPRIGYAIVDVRDLAELHLIALEAPEAAGQRFMAAGEFLWLGDIARILKARLGVKAGKVPTRTLPDALVRLIALVNPTMRPIVPDLGVRTECDSTKAARLLHWTTRPAAESIIDAAESLLARNLV